MAEMEEGRQREVSRVRECQASAKRVDGWIGTGDRGAGTK